jgi:hypothetical protein
MGCDIHLYCEVKEKINDVEQWFNCDHWQYNKWFIADKESEEEELECIPIYRARNYELFALLADVRNNGDIEPMAYPKGVPPDVSEVTKKQIVRWDSDGHSHSYFTYNELLFHRDIVKKKTHKYSGYVSLDCAERLDKGESYPDTWLEKEHYGWIYREWECSYVYQYLDELIDKAKERMKQEFWINDNSEYERHGHEFRFVFFFDN